MRDRPSADSSPSFSLTLHSVDIAILQPGLLGLQGMPTIRQGTQPVIICPLLAAELRLLVRWPSATFSKLHPLPLRCSALEVLSSLAPLSPILSDAFLLIFSCSPIAEALMSPLADDASTCVTAGRMLKWWCRFRRVLQHRVLGRRVLKLLIRYNHNKTIFLRADPRISSVNNESARVGGTSLGRLCMLPLKHRRWEEEALT